MTNAFVSCKPPGVFLLCLQSVVIDDVSAARIQKLLLIVTLVSYFPLLIVALGVILLLVCIILVIRFNQNKVIQPPTTPCLNVCV